MSANPLTEIAGNIQQTTSGLWVARSSQPVYFPADGHESCFRVEDRSFWFQHRNRCILWALRRFPPGGRLFDIGGGNGFVAQAIQQTGIEVAVVEPGAAGANNALKRGVREVIQGDLESIGLRPASLQAAGLFDVLEHIEDDRRFLTHLRACQARAGVLYLTVPALGLLWSGEDELGGHFRRYTLGGLVRLLEETGYRVEFASYFFRFLIIPIALGRVLSYRLGIKQEAETAESVRADHLLPGLPQRAVAALARRELRQLENGSRIRVGSSCLVVARRGEDPLPGGRLSLR